MNEIIKYLKELKISPIRFDYGIDPTPFKFKYHDMNFEIYYHKGFTLDDFKYAFQALYQYKIGIMIEWRQGEIERLQKRLKFKLP